MYPRNSYVVSETYGPMYRSNNQEMIPNSYPSMYPEDDRFFFAPFLGPFVVGGLAGTALGYGLANNNQLNNNGGGNNNGCCPIYYAPPVMPQQPYPTYTTNYYY